MRRMFLPVGQGAFYCEKFSDEDFGGKINTVYDCGSISGLGLLKSVIESAFGRSEEINAVFISHLHEDHINGLPYLMERCRVKRVYLPAINEGDLALMRLAYGIQRHPKSSAFDNQQDEYIKTTNFVRDVLLSPENAIANQAKQNNYDFKVDVVPIPPENDDEIHFRAGKTSQEIISDKIGNGVLSKWIYAPFNIRNETDAEAVKVRFRKAFGNDMSPSRIAELIHEATNGKEVLAKIRELYVGIKGGFNANSMVLYSGAVDKTLCQYSDFAKKNHDYAKYSMPDSTASGCLYLGDFMAVADYWAKLKTAYRKYWCGIGCVQIPHHGAEHNFNDEFLKMDAYSVISAGFGNKYHHPSNTVLRKYAAKGMFPFIVTQIPTSTFSAVVTIA